MRRTKIDIEQTMTLTTAGLDQARKELSRLVREAKKADTRFLLSERGKPQAVVLSIDEIFFSMTEEFTKDLMISSDKRDCRGSNNIVSFWMR